MAGGGVWTLLDAGYTAVFPAGLEPDPALVSEIRTFFPRYVPLLARRAYRTPTGHAGDAYGYHCIGAHITRWDKGEERKEPVRLQEVPSVWPYATGTVYAQRTWSLPWAKGSQQYRECWPDVYLPFDNQLVDFMRACVKEMYGEAQAIRNRIAKAMQNQEEAEQRELDKVQATARDKKKDDAHEWRDAVHNELFWLEHPDQRPQDPGPKPFVHVTGGAP